MTMKKSTEGKPMEAAGIVFAVTAMCIGVVAELVVATIMKGWALTVLWAWFAVPIFNLPPLSIAQALGVSLVVNFLTSQHVPQKEGETWQPFVRIILYPPLAVGIGWIIKGYM